MRPTRYARLLGGALVAIAAMAAAQAPDFGFMPDGGRGLFVQVFGADAAALAVLDEAGDIAIWTERILARDAGLDDKQTRTLAGFLSLNTPIVRTNGPAVVGGDAAASVPPDGRDIALAECQSCHSLFTGYLMQDRDVTGWLAVFKSPFHMTISLTSAELQTFADYSALNMPLRPDQVPPELRF